MTQMVHSTADLESAINASNVLFNGTINDLAKLDHDTFNDVMDGVPVFNLNRTELENGIGVLDLLAEKTKIFPSKGEARKMIQGGGVSINKEKVSAPEQLIKADALINNRYLVVQRGKKNYYLCNIN